MVGWYFSVYRQDGNGTRPVDPHVEPAECFATWQARVGGID